MLERLADQISFQGTALVLRAERQRTIAGNIANADTPRYAARDFNFSDALRQAGVAPNSTGQLALTAPASASGAGSSASTTSRFIPIGGSAGGGSPTAGYVAPSQPSMDGNTVDLDRERAAFADNAVRYEATLRFINGQAKTMLTAIQGQ